MPCGVGSHASPVPSESASAWSGFAVAGQLSAASGTPSPSRSSLAAEELHRQLGHLLLDLVGVQARAGDGEDRDRARRGRGPGRSAAPRGRVAGAGVLRVRGGRDQLLDVHRAGEEAEGAVVHRLAGRNPGAEAAISSTVCRSRIGRGLVSSAARPSRVVGVERRPGRLQLRAVGRVEAAVRRERDVDAGACRCSRSSSKACLADRRAPSCRPPAAHQQRRDGHVGQVRRRRVSACAPIAIPMIAFTRASGPNPHVVLRRRPPAR